MTITASEYAAWANNPDSDRALLVIIRPYSFADAAVVDMRFSDIAYQSEPSDSIGSQNFDPWLVGGISINYEIPFLTGGQGKSGVGEIVVSNAGAELDRYTSDYAFGGREVWVYQGDPAWPFANFEAFPAFRGVVSDAEVNGDEFVVRVGDVTDQLNREVQSNLIATGPNKGKPVPLAFGTVFNVSPVLVDANNLIYQWHDGPVGGVDAVKDNQVVLTEGVDYTVDNSTGTIRLLARPVGNVTLDGRGALYLGDHVKTAGAIATALLIDVFGEWAGDYIDTAALAAVDAERPYTLGVYISERDNLLSVLDSIFNSVGGGYFWNPVTEKFTAALVTGPGVTADHEFDDVDIVDISLESGGIPKFRSRIGYGRNWTVQSADSLASSITDPNIGDPATVERVGTEYQEAFIESAYVRTIWPNAVDGQRFDTLIQTEADANLEAERLGEIEGGQVVFCTAQIKTANQAVMPGDTVKITSADFGFESGRNIEVLGVKKFPADGTIELRGWFSVYSGKCAAYLGLTPNYDLDIGTTCGATGFETGAGLNTVL